MPGCVKTPPDACPAGLESSKRGSGAPLRRSIRAGRPCLRRRGLLGLVLVVIVPGCAACHGTGYRVMACVMAGNTAGYHAADTAFGRCFNRRHRSDQSSGNHNRKHFAHGVLSIEGRSQRVRNDGGYRSHVHRFTMTSDECRKISAELRADCHTCVSRPTQAAISAACGAHP